MASPSLDLSAYDISTTRGFLADPQLAPLQGKFEAWEEVFKNLSSHIEEGNLKEKVAELPSLEISDLQTKQEWKRAYVLLTFIGQSILPNVLPENLAASWKEVSEHLGLKPFVSYAAVVLYNFSYDSTKPTEVERFSSCGTFTGLPDESWFYVVHMATEVAAAQGLNAIVKAYDCMDAKKYDDVTQCLIDLAASLQDMIREREHMFDKRINEVTLKCDPTIFYNKLRPFFSNRGGITYKDENGENKKFRGASGAQTTTIYAFDKFLGLQYSDETTKEEIQDIQSYMPKVHRQFLVALEAQPSVREFCQNSKNGRLIKSYNDAIDDLLEFRDYHHKRLVGKYIFHPKCQQEIEPQSTDEERGTGGTKLSHFLKTIIEDTKKLKIKQSVVVYIHD